MPQDRSKVSQEGSVHQSKLMSQHKPKVPALTATKSLLSSSHKSHKSRQHNQSVNLGYLTQRQNAISSQQRLDALDAQNKGHSESKRSVDDQNIVKTSFSKAQSNKLQIKPSSSQLHKRKPTVFNNLMSSLNLQTLMMKSVGGQAHNNENKQTHQTNSFLVTHGNLANDKQIEKNTLAQKDTNKLNSTVNSLQLPPPTKNEKQSSSVGREEASKQGFTTSLGGIVGKVWGYGRVSQAEAKQSDPINAQAENPQINNRRSRSREQQKRKQSNNYSSDDDDNLSGYSGENSMVGNMQALQVVRSRSHSRQGYRESHARIKQRNSVLPQQTNHSKLLPNLKLQLNQTLQSQQLETEIRNLDFGDTSIIQGGADTTSIMQQDQMDTSILTEIERQDDQQQQLFTTGPDDNIFEYDTQMVNMVDSHQNYYNNQQEQQNQFDSSHAQFTELSCQYNDTQNREDSYYHGLNTKGASQNYLGTGYCAPDATLGQVQNSSNVSDYNNAQNKFYGEQNYDQQQQQQNFQVYGNYEQQQVVDFQKNSIVGQNQLNSGFEYQDTNPSGYQGAINGQVYGGQDVSTFESPYRASRKTIRESRSRGDTQKEYHQTQDTDQQNLLLNQTPEPNTEFVPDQISAIQHSESVIDELEQMLERKRREQA